LLLLLLLLPLCLHGVQPAREGRGAGVLLLLAVQEAPLLLLELVPSRAALHVTVHQQRLTL
jgi:hypothetical protein